MDPQRAAPWVQPAEARLNFARSRPTMQSVNQVSLPMRIALVATLAFSMIWFVALRPKPVPTSNTPAPPTASPQSVPGKAAQQAEQAAGASAQSGAKHEQAAGATPGAEPAATGTPATPATASKPATAQATAEPGKAIDVEKASGDNVSKAALSVLRDVNRGKVAVLLFWDRRLSDDRAVQRAVSGLSRRGGKVAVHRAPIAKLAEFEPITRGVPVVTSPTVLVIDRAGRARAVGGLSVPSELEELVGKALKVKP